jgi:Zn finger protein HypA/HybF involved in hydrogenase expression
MVFGKIYNSYIIRKQAIHLQKLQRMANMSDLVLTCAYCSKPSDVTVDLTQENTYICPKCKNTNKIIVQYFTTRITVPLIEKVDASPIIEEDVNKEVKNDG